MTKRATVLLGVAQIYIQAQEIYCLSLEIQNRRNFIIRNGILSISSSAASFPQDSLASQSEIPQADTFNLYNDAMYLLDDKTVKWTTQSQRTSGTSTWNTIRYRSSTLSTNSKNYTPTPDRPTYYPEWMEGYWSVNYKFKGASFPQGRKILSLRTAGAGLGTCLSLPNVGYNPPVHAAHFLKSHRGIAKGVENVYEDLAYNIPRKFEAFWPQSKVLSVQTNGHDIEDSKEDNYSSTLSPRCFVTGEGCTAEENNNLHLPASRLAMDFDGPTRRSGRLTQSCDVTMVDNFYAIQPSGTGDAYVASKSYSQFNINQDLQTFYREILSLEKIKQGNGNFVVFGKVRVAAFLPKYIKALDTGNSAGDYDDNNAVAIYDYKVLMESIDKIEAASL